MTVVLPLWALILLAVAPAFTGWLGARYGARGAAMEGARIAIETCRRDQNCPLRKSEERAAWNDDLEQQHRMALASHPELVAVREAAKRALRDTGSDLPAMPEGTKG